VRLRSLLIPLLFATAASPAWAKSVFNFNDFPIAMHSEVVKRFPLAEKEGLSPEQMDELIRFIQSKFLFDQVQIYQEAADRDVLKVHYEKTKRVSDVKFVGLTGFEDAEARNYFTLKPGDIFDQDVIVENGEALRQAYRNIGFLNAVIDIELPPDEKDNSVTVLVKITENKRTRISSIKFNSANAPLNKILNGEIKVCSAHFIFCWDREHTKALTENRLTTIQKQIRELLAKHHYYQADINGPEVKFSADESTAELTYQLDKVTSYSVSIVGYKAETPSSLMNSLELENFYTANPSVGPELVQKLRNFYLGRGYARVDVTSTEMEGRSEFEKKIVLTASEGSKVRIQKIVVNGKLSRDPAYYENFIRDNSSPLVKKGTFNKEDLDQGYKNLTLQLQNEGYLVAKIISTRSQYSRDKNQVTLIINLDEGPLTQIENISFTGNSDYPGAQLLQVTGLASSGPLKLNQIESAVANLKNFYREQGYIEMMLLNERQDLVSYNEDNTRAKMNFKIFEGPKVRVSSIAIQGNTFTKDWVILKEIDLQVGDIVTPSKLDDSIARLQRTGFFGNVEVHTLEEKTQVSERTLIVKVTERDPGVFTIGAGATNERRFTIRGYTAAGYRNLGGTGRGVSLRLEGNYNIADVKYLERNITFGYLEPYLFGSRVRGRINLTQASEVVDYDLRKIRELKQQTYSVEKDLTPHVLGMYQVYGLATIKQSGLDQTSYSDNSSYDIATTGPSLDIDYRDNPFNPTKGTFTHLSAEYSTPTMGSTSTVNYWTATASFTHYLKMSDGPIVWANNVRGGYLKNLASPAPDGAAYGVPYDIKGFTLGGRTTVRGYDAGTQDVFPNNADLGSENFRLTTSARMFLIKSEIRFPIWGAIGGAIFYDGGSVTIEGLDFPDSYHDSTGFALRYATPFGPVSLEWAWKLDNRNGEQGPHFNFAIGTF
jgi:outer membrane protein insertion porin family